MFNWNNSGMSVMELSHRSKEFVQISDNSYICTIVFDNTLNKPKKIRIFYEKRIRRERCSDFKPITE